MLQKIFTFFKSILIFKIETVWNRIKKDIDSESDFLKHYVIIEISCILETLFETLHFSREVMAIYFNIFAF